MLRLARCGGLAIFPVLGAVVAAAQVVFAADGGNGDRLPERRPVQAKHRLEEDSRFWGVQSLNGATWDLESTEFRALDGRALRCLLAGGKPYSSVYLYRPLPARPASRRFTLELSFLYKGRHASPAGSGPAVQALEFLVGKLQKPSVYEWRVQWRGGTGGGKARWHYWNPDVIGNWVPTDLPGDLEEGVWHTLSIGCRIRGSRVCYETIAIDGQTNSVKAEIRAGPLAEDGNRMNVGFQLIGNARAEACELIVDEVSLGD